MTTAVSIRSDVRCAAGSSHLVTVAEYESLTWRDGLEGSEARLVVRRGSPADPFCQGRRVLRIADPALGTTAVWEYDIRSVHRSRHTDLITVRAVGLIERLTRVLIKQETLGITGYTLTDTRLPVEWIDQLVLPVLVAAGMPWISRGTIDLLVEQKLALGAETVRGLLERLRAGSDRELQLRYLANDAGYVIDAIAIGASAPSPRFVVGANVIALESAEDAEPQLTALIPQGATPAGASYRGDVGEYAARIATINVGAGEVTLADPDGNVGPLYFDGQEDGRYLEYQVPYRLVWPETDPAQGPPSYFGAKSVRDVAYTSATGHVWVTRRLESKVYIYDANNGLAYVTSLATGTNPVGIGYDAATNQILVANEGGDSISVFNATALTLTTTIALGGTGLGAQYMARAGNGDWYVACVNASSGVVKVIDPPTNTLVTTIALGTSDAGDITYAVTPNRLYCAGSSIKVIDPTTNTVVATISGLGGSARGVTWASSTDRVYASIQAPGTVKVIKTSDNTVESTITGFSSPSFCSYDATANRVYQVDGANQDLLRIINAATAAVETTVTLASGLQHMGGAIAGQGLFLIPAATTLDWLIAFVPATQGVTVRRQVTASRVADQALVLAGGVPPMAVGALVSFRTTLAGGLQSILTNPGTTVPYTVEGFLDRADLRTERNYCLNPWLRTTTNAIQAPFWDRRIGTGAFPTPHTRWLTRDASAWKTFAAVLDGAHSLGQQVIAVRGMTVGDVIEPGDSIQVASDYKVHAATRGVVDGAGKTNVVSERAAGLLLAHVDGAAVTIQRSGVVNADFLVPGQGPALYHLGTVLGSYVNDLGVYFPVPYLPGRSRLSCTVEVLLWCDQVTPSTNLTLSLESLGGVVLGTANPTDATAYTDGVVRRYTVSLAYTLTSPVMLGLWLKGSGMGFWTAYPLRFQATLGPEDAIAPAMEINGSSGELYHVGWRELRNRVGPAVAYTLAAQENDPARPFVKGATGRLVDGALVAYPRIVSVTHSPRLDDAMPAPLLEVATPRPQFVRRLVKSGAL